MRETLITKVHGVLQSEQANIVLDLTSRYSYEEPRMCSQFSLVCLRLECNRLCVVLCIVFTWATNIFQNIKNISKY